MRVIGNFWQWITHFIHWRLDSRRRNALGDKLADIGERGIFEIGKAG